MENNNNNDLETLKALYEHPRAPKEPRKKLRLIILSIVGVIVIAAIVSGVLFFVTKNKTTLTSTPTGTVVTGGPSADEVIQKIEANSVIAAATDYNLQEINSTDATATPDTQTIVYATTPYKFLANVAPEKGVQFTLADASGNSNKDAITTAIQDTLKEAGFTEQTQDVTSLSVFDRTTYVNKGTVCQLLDFAKGSLAPTEQSILCVANTSLNASYKNINDLLTKADASVADTAKTVSQTTITDGAKKLYSLIVLADGADTTNTYYFATLGTDYEYLGKRATPSVDNEASYTPPSDLKAKISDPKWGTFLTDNIK